MNVHKCPVPGCKAVITTKRLMCLIHWQMVPGPLQNAVYRTWRTKNRVAHLAAAKAAIEFVSRPVKSQAQG